MNRSYIVGKVWNEIEKEFQSVVGFEFGDSLGFFQFFEIGTNGHFRKSPAEYDSIAPISCEIFNQLKESSNG